MKRVTIALMLLFSACAGPALAGPALMLDAEDGRVLYAENPDRPWHPASLTKLMTAYLAFEAIRDGTLSMDTKLVVSKTALKQPPSKVGAPVGTKMSVGTGLRAIIIKSANDVAVMFAEKIAGSVEAFADKMNAKALTLGMASSHFVNPNGLHDVRQVTTARDLARLARAVLNDFPEQAHFFAEPKMKLGKRTIRSYNRLLRKFDGADGMKTGFICPSGFNIVASATRDGKKLIVVVLGARTAKRRNTRAAKMLENGFKTRVWKTALLQDTIETLAIGPRAGEAPKNMRSIACKRRRIVRRKRRGKRRRITRRKHIKITKPRNVGG